MESKKPVMEDSKKGSSTPLVWTQEEDEMLQQWVKTHGTKKWTMLSHVMKTKRSKQCRRRWINKFSIETKTARWSLEEDRVLLETQQELGNRWTAIAKKLGGRTDNAVKNRYYALAKKLTHPTNAHSSHCGNFRGNTSNCTTPNCPVLHPQPPGSTSAYMQSLDLSWWDLGSYKEGNRFPLPLCLDSTFAWDQYPSTCMGSLDPELKL